MAALLLVPAARAQSPYRIAQGELQVAGLSAGVQPATPVVPRNTGSALRIVVRAGERVLTAAEVAAALGADFRVEAELSGPGLPQTLSLPRAGDPPPPDRLLLALPPLSRGGTYQVSGLRLASGGRAVLDAAPGQVALRVIDQVLVTSVRTRPLTRDEIRERGVLLDSQALLGFEFALALKLDSDRVNIRFPVVFDRQGVPHPPTIPLPPLPDREGVALPPLPTIVPMLIAARGLPGEEGGPGPIVDLALPSGEPVRIPSVLVIPGNVGYLKQFFSAQLLVANGAPAGSGLRLRELLATIKLPPGPDLVPGTPDDPLALPATEGGPAPSTLAVRGVGPDGEPGTPDDGSELGAAEQGQAEFLVRGDAEGFHALAFDIAARLEGLPSGPVGITGYARGGVLVRNALFDMSFTAPSVVRRGEQFRLYATVTNIGKAAAHDLTVALDASRLSGARLACPTPPCPGSVVIGSLAAGDARTIDFLLESERTGRVVASYLRLQPGSQNSGRLEFTLGVGERDVPLSPDTLVLPAAVDTLPAALVEAAMRVLGQGWSIARAAPSLLPGEVTRTDAATVQKKALALAEAGLRVQLGQAPGTAARDLVLDLWGGAPPDPGYDELLRKTRAGRDLVLALGQQLAGDAAADPLAYEDALARVAASGPDVVTFAVRSTGAPVEATVADRLGRRTRSLRDASALPLAEVPGAAVLPLGPPATAPLLGVLAAPSHGPYVLTLSAPAQASVSYPSGGQMARAAVTTSAPARIVVDFAQPALRIEEDANGDGSFETVRSAAAAAVPAEGPRLLAATLIGPETLDGAEPMGLQVGLLFDRLVDEAQAGDKERYQVPRNAVAAARRQLSGRLVFASLALPEGRYLPTTFSTSGVADARGRPGLAATVPLASRVMDPGAVVTGRVVEADGRPVAGALVRYANAVTTTDPPCRRGSFGELVAAPTDADGRYELRYVRRDPCGRPFEIAVHDPVTGARRSVRLFVRTGGEHIVADVALLGRGAVTGIVRDASGAPVPGARVQAVSVTDPMVGGSAVGDGQGRYTVHGITVGAVNVVAVKGALVGRAAGTIATAGATASVDVRLEGTSASIGGTVRKLEQGQLTHVPGIPVLYYHRPSGQLLGVATTSDSGRYAFAGMPAGDFTVRAALNTRDQASLDHRADPGQTIADLDIVIEVAPEAASGAVRGTVRLPNGSAAAGVVVTVQNRGVLTDADGRYEIGGLTVPSNPRVTAATRDGLRTGSAWALLSAAHPVAEGIDVTLSAMGRVHYTVLDAAGQPIAGQPVALLGGCPNPCGCRTSATNPQGQVAFDVPVGTHAAKAIRTADPLGNRDVAEGAATVSEDGATGYAVVRFAGMGALSGRVLEGQTTTAVHGAEVVVYGNRFVNDGYAFCGLRSEEIARRTTDSGGNFQVASVNAGPVVARASHPIITGAAVATGTVSPQQPAALTLRLANTLAGELSGTVYGPDGVTPAGAGVEVTAFGVLPDVVVHTTADGRYRFAAVLPEGRYSVTARDPSSGRSGRIHVYLRAGQEAAHDVRLLGQGTVAVTVVDGGGRPASAGSVRLRHVDHPFRVYEGAIEPANGGVVTFTNVVEGPFSVEVADPFGRGGRAAGALPGPGESVEVKVALTVTGSVQGSFLMPDGAPIPYGTVLLVAGGRALGQVTTAGSGDVGSFAFSHVPAGPLRLEALDPRTGRAGLAVGTIEVQDQAVILDVRAQPLGIVEGDVTSNGAPEPAALVSVASGSYRVATAVDEAGHYRVTGVPEGRVTVNASLAAGYLQATRSAPLLGEGTVLDLDVALRPTGTVQGTLHEADGTSPALGVVTLKALGVGGTRLSRTTGEGGAFEFLRVASGKGAIEADELGSIDRAAAAIEVPENAVLTVPLRLNGVGGLRGVARSSGGAPTGGTLLIEGTGPFPYRHSLNLGPNGVFDLPELPAGPVTLKLSVAGAFTLYGSATGEVLPGSVTDLDVQLQPSGSVTGIVLRPGGTAPAFGADVRLQHARGVATTQAQSDGRFTVRGVPLGALLVRVHDPVTGGRAAVRGASLDVNGQALDVGTLTLDNVAPLVTVVAPEPGSTRAPLAGPITVDLADDTSGVDTSTFTVFYPPHHRQDASAFTFTGGRATGSLAHTYVAIGANTIVVSVADNAGNVAERPVTFTVTGATARGHVRWANGAAVPGAQVQVDFGAAVSADGAGYYVRTGLRSGGSVTATDPVTGFQRTVFAPIYDGEDRAVDVTLPAHGFVVGSVRRPSGAPASGVQVSSGPRTAGSGADGSFNLGAFELGAHTIEAVDPARGDRGRTAVNLTVPGQTVQAALTLSGAGRVTVRVRDGGAPVPAAAVTVTSSSPLAQALSGTANAQGEVVFPQVLAGTVTASAAAGTRGGQATAVLADGGDVAVTVTLEAGGTVTGTLRRPDGAPAPGLPVRITGSTTATTMTDQAGAFGFAGVRVGAFELKVDDPATDDFASASGTLPAAGATIVRDLTLNGLGTVHARVLDSSGAAVPGARVDVRSSANPLLLRSVTAGADGRATVANVLAGNLTVSALDTVGYRRGEASAALSPAASVEVPVTLSASGRIRGRVLDGDGATPLAGVRVQTWVLATYIYPVTVVSAADGRYELPPLPVGTYTVEAHRDGVLRARQAGVALTADGSIVERDLVLTAVGTVRGRVTGAAAQPVAGAPVHLNSQAHPFGGLQSTTTDAAGNYVFTQVTAAPFTLAATNPAQTERVDTAGAITAHGQELSIDLQLLPNAVTLPLVMADGNAMTWKVEADGSATGQQSVGFQTRAGRLTIVRDGVPHAFAGAGTTGSSEEDRRETVVRQTVAGLTITRKAYVPADGYFLRLLDLFANPSPQPAAVEVVYTTPVGNGSPAGVVATSTGDLTLAPDDRWLVVDDSVTADVYDLPGQAPIGITLSGSGGLAPSTASFSGGQLEQRYQLTVPGGGAVALLQVFTPQADRARANASAIRLAELPPELLAGMLPSEASAVANFAVPADLASPLTPLPLNDGVVTGRLLGGDGVAPVPGVALRFRSRSPHYGRPYTALYATEADGRFVFRHSAPPSAVRLVPRTEFDLTATAPSPFGPAPAATGGTFPTAGLRDLAAVPGAILNASSFLPHFSSLVPHATDGNLGTFWQSNTGDSTQNGTFPFLEVALPAAATVHEVRLRSRRDLPGADASTIRSARIELLDEAAQRLWHTEVALPASPVLRDADVPVPAVPNVRRVRIVDLADGGRASLAELQVIGESAAGATRATTADVVFSTSGTVAGRVLRADATPVANAGIALGKGAFTQYLSSTAEGAFTYPVVPPGTYSLSATLQQGGVTTSATGLVVDAGARLTRDLVFPAFGRIAGTLYSAANQPVVGSVNLVVNGATWTRSNVSAYAFDDVPAGTFSLSATDRRSQAQVTTAVVVTPPQTTGQDFILPPVGTVDVTATVAGNPLAGGRVFLRTASRGPAWISVGTTNAAGTLRLTNVPGPAFDIRVEHPASAHSFGEASATLSEAQTVPVAVAVPGVGTVAGRLLTRDGTALAGHNVKALGADGAAVYATATTNASGAFQLANVPVGPLRLRSTVSQAYAGFTVLDEAERSAALLEHNGTLAADALAARGVLASGEKHLWTLPRTAGQATQVMLLGTAVGAASALADPYLEVYGPGGQLVAANDNRGSGDPNSEASFTAAAAGDYVVLVRAAGAQAGGYRLGGHGEGLRVFRQFSGATVRGLVTRQSDGAALPGATVRLTMARPGGVPITLTAATGADGRYTFPEVLTEAGVEAALIDGAYGRVAVATATTAEAGTALDLPLVWPSLGAVNVTVRRVTTPLAGIATTVVSDNVHAAPALRTQTAHTAGNGMATLPRVPAGTVTASVVDPATGQPVQASGVLIEGATLALDVVLPAASDTTAPGTVTDLAVQASGSQVLITWTATGDDGAQGTAAACDLRHAPQPMTASSFLTATAIATPAPAAAGTPQSVLASLPPGARSFALRCRDEVPNWGALSNQPSFSAGPPAQGLKLWLRADAGVTTAGTTSYVAGWADQSGNANHATQSTASAQPLLVPGEANGLPVLRFDGTGDFVGFTNRITGIHTVFWVVKETASTNGYRFLLGDTTASDFASDNTRRIWSSSYASPSVLNGETRLNGAVVNGTTTNRPTSLSLVSLVTAGPVSAASFSRDRTNGNYWAGDLAELLVYDRALPDDERRAVEDHLAARYALFAPPRRAPRISPDGGRFSEPVTVTISGEGLVRYTLDGSDPSASAPVYEGPFVVAPPATVKARAWAPDGSDPSPVAAVTFLDTGGFTPASLSGLRLWVRADAGAGEALLRSGLWRDQSGLGNDLTQPAVLRHPLLVPGAAGPLPALRFDGNDFLSFTTRLTAVRTVFWVVRDTAPTDGYRFLLGDTTNADFSSNAARRIWDSTWTSPAVRNGVTRLNGAVVNGTLTNRPTTMSVLSLVTTGPVAAASFSSDRSNGRHWWGDLAELIVFDTALSDADRLAVEQYLAARYGITLQP